MAMDHHLGTFHLMLVVREGARIHTPDQNTAKCSFPDSKAAILHFKFNWGGSIECWKTRVRSACGGYIVYISQLDFTDNYTLGSLFSSPSSSHLPCSQIELPRNFCVPPRTTYSFLSNSHFREWRRGKDCLRRVKLPAKARIGGGGETLSCLLSHWLLLQMKP